MELRSCTNLHFIQAVKGGLVIKTLNVNRGRPLLKFKILKDIYETEDLKNQNSFLEPKEEFEDFISDGNNVKVERITISDPNISEFSCSNDNGTSDSDFDDLGAGKMTLKQIQEKCKAKKRKLSKFIDSRNEELCKHVKQETIEDECDLTEPLILWKSKLSKKVKTKRGCLKDQASSKSALPAIKDEPETFAAPIKVEPDCLDTANAVSFNGDSLIYDNQVDSYGEGQKPREVNEMVMDCDWEMQASCPDSQNKKCFVGNSSLIYDNQVDSCGDSKNPKEVTEIVTECELGGQSLCSESQTATCFTGTFFLIYNNQVDSCGIVPREVTETVTECDRGAGALISLTKGPQHFASVAYPEFMDHANSGPVKIVDSHEDSCGTVSREVTETATEAVLGMDKLISLVEDPQSCVVNEVCYKNADHAHSEPLQIASDLCDDIKEADIPEINNDQCSDLPVSESNEGYVDQRPCADTSRQPIFPISDEISAIHDDFRSPTNEEISCNIGSKKDQISDVAIHGCLHYHKSSHRSDACAPVGNAKDGLLSNLESSALHSSDVTCNSDPESWFSPLADGPPTFEEQQSQSSTSAGTERHSFSQTLHQDTCEELTTSDDGDYYSKLPCPPQRLLSTRKAISPDSQEKLCKVMESIDLQEEEHYKPQKELSFGQQTGKETKINTAERSAKISRVRFSVNQKQNIARSENGKRRDQTEGVPKGTNPSQAVPRLSTGCNSIEVCSQSAIAFSQRQMQDIECLATKLTNELKTMKEIAEDRLYSEASPATSLRFKANEVRMALKNATKVEQQANRWLSMMARDCNRFCKIMRLADKDSSAPESEGVVNKERKKITFADEAGEKLCHVRFIENKLTSSLEPDTEKPEVLN